MLPNRTNFNRLWMVFFITLSLLHPAVVRAQTLAEEADLQLSMLVSPNPVISGANVTLTFQATNPLAQAVPFPQVVITLPPRTHFLTAGSDPHCQVTESVIGSLPGYSRVTCAFDELHGLVGSLPYPLIFAVTVSVHDFIPSGTLLPISALLTSSLPDPQMANNSVEPNLRVNAPRFYKSFVPVGLFTITPGAPIPGVIYVDWRASGANNGTSWQDAFTDLSSAIRSAHPSAIAPLQVWVATGVYYPSTSDRSVSFQLKNYLSIYGGFSGYESRPEDRLLGSTSGSVLSGEIGSTLDFDNAYHVVTATNLNQTALLDGFVIRGGNASATGSYGRGGGIILSGGSPVLQQLVFQNNRAAEGGGGLYLENTSPTLDRLRFTGNQTPGLGGGLLLSNASPQLTNLIFRENTADSGGAIASQAGSSLTLINGVFWGNSANVGAALYTDSGTVNVTNTSMNANRTSNPYSGGLHIKDADLAIHNSILWGNTSSTGAWQEFAREGLGSQQIDYSIIEGMIDNEEADIRGETDPLFINPAQGNLSITTASPAVDRGSEMYLPYNIHTDLSLAPRSTGASVDQGAFETTAHAPVLTPFTRTLPEIREDIASENNSGLLVADLLAGNVTDPDPGSPLGMAITYTTSGLGGSWQVSIDGGVHWRDVGLVYETSVMVIDAGPQTRLRFQPGNGMNDQATLTLRAWDRSDRYAPLSSGINPMKDGLFQSYSETTAQIIQPVHGVADTSLTLTPSFAGGMPQGRTITLTATARNPEPQWIPQAVVTFTLPPYLSFRPEGSDAACLLSGDDPSAVGASAVTCHIGGLPYLGSVEFPVVVVLSSSAPLREQLTINADLVTDQIDPNTSNNSAAYTVRVLPGVAVLYLPSVFR